jgi:alkanesulfonate monooxygenase SsuD/methylene tetrahydromethanopterin reductase-like flavin-dependent oxidoreductase (luciferase family)
MSVTVPVICGATRAEADGRLARLGEPGERMLARGGALGEPAEVAQRLHDLADEGCEIAYLHIFDIDDLDHLRLIGAEVLPQVA